MKYTLEIATFNFQSGLLAAQAGADRIEVCDNMAEGGTSPSYGTIKLLKEHISIPVFAMIRARGGDFLYNEVEFAAMLKDLQLYKELGCEGIVFGFLNSDGTINKKMTRRFVEAAYPMEVTFHRAFDRSVDPLQALEDIIECGCQRILTSGQKPFAQDGIGLLKQLVDQAGERIIILPGCGVLSNNIKLLAEQTGAVELHSSAKILNPSSMKFINPLMNEILDTVSVDVEDIKKMKNELGKLA